MIENAYILSRLAPSIEWKFKLATIDSPAVADEMRHGALCHTHDEKQERVFYEYHISKKLDKKVVNFTSFFDLIALNTLPILV